MAPAIQITPQELAKRTDALVLDASWIYRPFQRDRHIDIRAEFGRKHIPGSCFVDLDQLRDPDKLADTRLDILTTPRPGVLTKLMEQVSAGHDDLIVVSDMDGAAATAPFLRYALIEDGFTNVRLLEGGLPGWRNVAGGPVSASCDDAHYLDAGTIAWPGTGNTGASGTVFMDYTAFQRSGLQAPETCIIDARFAGNRDAGLPCEYDTIDVPATHHIGYGEIIADQGFWQTFKDRDQLAALFNHHGLRGDGTMITHCYFGMAASNMMTALELAGYPRGRIYAGGLIDYANKSGLVSAPAAG